MTPQFFDDPNRVRISDAPPPIQSITLPAARAAAHRGWRRLPLRPRAALAKSTLVVYLVAVVFRLAALSRDLFVVTAEGSEAIVATGGGPDTVAAASVAVFGSMALAAFIAWLYRVWGNWATQGRPRHSDTWVVLGWFVPPVNLWLPAQVVADMYAERPGLRRLRTADARRVWMWWVTGVVGFTGRLYLLGRELLDVEPDPVERYLAPLVHLFLAISAVIGLRIIAELTERHDVHDSP